MRVANSRVGNGAIERRSHLQAATLKILLSLTPLVLLGLLGACVMLGFQPPDRYDDRSFSILNLNLFHQRIPSTMSNRNWRGDWLFRRERLELVDEQLRVSRPDIVVLQEVLAKRGSPSESDINILSYGALEGYEWDADSLTFYRDTQEVQYQAVAVGLPVKLAGTETALNKSFWPIGMDGFMSYSLLELDQRPVLIVNLTMPGSGQKVDYWYKYVRNEIRDLLAQLKLCRQRLIVSGFVPGSLVWAGYADFLNEFELKDTSSGFCEAASDCLTSSTQNELFMATSQGQSPSHSERILVHRDAIVSSSSVVLNKMRDQSVYASLYGLQRLWPSRVFGWLAEVRLAQCGSEGPAL